MKLFNEGRTAVVTGAAQGIGLAIAKRFVEEEITNIAIIDVNEAKLNAAAEELGKLGSSNVMPVVCNIADKDDVDAKFGEIIARFGAVDILVNNAGIIRDAMFHKMTFEQFDLVVKVNLYGTFNCCKAVWQQMRDRGYGRIVNFSSSSSHGNVGQVNYTATKGAIVSMTKTLAKEGARKGITANILSPDFIDTDMLRAIPADQFDNACKSTPMQRPGKPEEIASAVVFLCSEDASYVSGTDLFVAGAKTT